LESLDILCFAIISWNGEFLGWCLCHSGRGFSCFRG